MNKVKNDIDSFDLFIDRLSEMIKDRPDQKSEIIREEVDKLNCPYLKDKVDSLFQ